ncbi:MAG: ATP-dependent helicase [Lautropia sp.]
MTSEALVCDWLDHLNPEQRHAVTFDARDGDSRDSSRGPCRPLLVIAGAGTGKTSTLAHRVAWLVLQGADPQRMLLLTFSRRAASDMTRRAERLVAAVRGANGSATRLAWAGTFHAIGARILRECAERVGLEPGFGILDRADAADLIDLVREEQGLATRDRRFPRKDTCLAIYSYRVNAGLSLTEVLAHGWPWCAGFEADLTALFRTYVERKQAQHVLDYDDLLLWWHGAMQDAAFAEEIGARFDHVLVDEYQDTNALQAQIVLALKPDGRGVTVVGDDAQSIYSFRAAQVDNILAFPARFDPPASRVTLQINYRSVQPVLDTANCLIAQSTRQYPKTLCAERGGGAKPVLVTVLDDRGQADHVVAEVLRQREAGVALRRQAVLFRSSHHSDLLEVELARRNIPFVKYGGLKFLEAAHVKDLLAVLRWADNAYHEIAGFRTLQLLPGIGPALARRAIDLLAGGGHRFDALRAFDAPPAAADAWASLVELLVALADPAGEWAGQVERVRRWYQPLLEARFDDAFVRAADLDMMAAVSGQFASRERFLTELTLDPPQAGGDLAGTPLVDEDYLVLSTVHSAKGQEWDAVYVLNVADGNFPNEFSTGSDAGIEEERRLLYVAVTRARDTLHLIEPQRYYVTQQARLGDRHVHGARSRFLTPALVATLDRHVAASGSVAGLRDAARRGGPARPVVHVGERIKGMWE